MRLQLPAARSAVFAGLLLLSPVAASGAFWLQESYGCPGHRADAGKTFVMTEGAFPQGKPVTEPGDARLLMRNAEALLSEQNLTDAAILFHPPHKGNYHLFVERRYVKAGVLHVDLTKTRVYNKEGDVSQSLFKEFRGKTVGSYYGKAPLKEIPFEIVMQEPVKRHHINCCIYSGDIARFKIYFGGELQKTIPLKVLMQTGWNNTVGASEDGMIAFEVPRNTYADIRTDKRHMERMLVEASHTVEAGGTFGGEPYTKVRYSMSIPLTFHASPLEYSSKVSGFLTVVGVMLAFSLGAYYHRRKKRKTPTEIWFDESA